MGWRDVVEGGERCSVEQGDCLEMLAQLPAGCAALVFGSPPYELARAYYEGGRDLGIARDTEAWVAWMARVVKASLRVCNGLVAFVVEGQTKDYRYSCGPALLMADLHRAGVCLRRPLFYHRVGIPGSGGPDWARGDTEFIVCATGGGKLPWSDNTAMGHAPKFASGGEISHRRADGTRVNAFGCSRRGAGVGGRRRDGRKRSEEKGQKHTEPAKPGYARAGKKDGDTRNGKGYDPPALANPGNVVDRLYTASEVAALLGGPADLLRMNVGGGQMGGDEFSSQNEAPFSERLAEHFVRSWCPPGGLVVEPFAGSGTTPAVALRWGRRCVAFDLRESQVALARKRLAAETPLALFAAGDAKEES